MTSVGSPARDSGERTGTHPARRRDKRTWVALFVLLSIAALHTVLSLRAVDAYGALDHDSVISHLEASGHMDEWSVAMFGLPPRGEWASGAEFRDYLEIDDQSSLGQVQASLTDTDIHPPLYFWALYGAKRLGLGVFRAGPAINIVASLAVIGLLYFLLAKVLRDRLLAAVGVGAYALSPSVLLAVSFTRQYIFMALAVTLLIWMTALVLENPRSPIALVGLGVTCTFGFLSAYQFMFGLVGAFIVIAVAAWRRRSFAVLGWPVLAAGAGLVVGLLVHPGFREQLTRYDQRLPGFALDEVNNRFQDSVHGLFDLVTLEDFDRFLEPIVLVVLAALLVTLPSWYRPAAKVVRAQPIVAAACGVGLFLLLGTVVPYVLGRAPEHNLGQHYVSALAPPLVIVGVFAISRIARRRLLVLVAVVALIGIYALKWEDLYRDDWGHQRASVNEARGAQVVVADCPLRGHTPGAAMWVPERSSFLLAARDGAPPPLPAGVERTPAVLFHGAECAGAQVTDVDGMLADLGYERGTRVGYIGKIEVFRLEPIAGQPDDDG